MKGDATTCPNCGGSVIMDANGKSGVCMQCGHKVKVSGRGFSYSFGTKGGLGFSFGMKSGGNDEVDTDDAPSSPAFKPSSRSLSEALSYWTGYAEGMGKDEAKELYGTIAEEIASGLYSDAEENVPLNGIMHLCDVIDDKFDESDGEEYCDFYVAVYKKAFEMLSELGDSPDLPYHLSGFMILSLAAGGRYASIECQRDMFASMSDDISNLVDDIDDDYCSDAEFNGCADFFDMVVSQIDSALRSVSESELERLTEYWIRSDMGGIRDSLLYAREADSNAREAGLFGASKYKNKRKEHISAYVNGYFEPLRNGLC